MMSAEEHLAEAERLLELASERSMGYTDGYIQSLAARSEAHTALAIALRELEGR
jgi:hypothetical protein